jgi:hypothetical protein
MGARNLWGMIAAIVAATVASSIALIGFGLDWVIEVSSAAAVAWQFSGKDSERRERIALRITAGSFFALATYVTVEAVRALLVGARRSDQPWALFWSRSVWRSCRCCLGRNVAQGGIWDRPVLSLTPSRRSGRVPRRGGNP